MREQPSYLRVAEVLRQRIADQEWTPGDRLPSRGQLAQECGVSEAVIRTAQEMLISQGVLEGRAGSGTYVAAPRERLRMVRSQHREQGEGSPFHADMAALGKRGTWESRSDAMVPAPPDIAARLGISEGDYCVRTSYEYLADGRPAQLSVSWEPYSITSGTLVVLPEGGPLAGKGVVRRMSEIGIIVSHAVEMPEPGHAMPRRLPSSAFSVGRSSPAFSGPTTATMPDRSKRLTSSCLLPSARSSTKCRSIRDRVAPLEVRECP